MTLFTILFNVWCDLEHLRTVEIGQSFWTIDMLEPSGHENVLD